MLSPEEISAWSLEELQAELHALLPSGWKCASSQHPSGYWMVTIRRADDSGVLVTEFEGENADQRLAYLDAFGWLWFRTSSKPAEGSPWVRRRELSRALVTKQVSLGGTSVPDPEDLNPAEIELAYKNRT